MGCIEKRGNCILQQLAHFSTRTLRQNNFLSLLLLSRSIKLWNAVHIMSSIGRIT